MSKGIIIAGFATVGKTYLSKKYNTIVDMESSYYKYDYSNYDESQCEELKGSSERKMRQDWPDNYYKAIQEAQQKYDIVFVQLHPIHLEYFDKNKIEYYIAYPSLDSWEWVQKRSIERGNNEEWIAKLKEAFEPYYELSKQSNCKDMFIVNEKILLEDILKDKKFI